MAPHTPNYLGHRGWHPGALAAFKNCDPTPSMNSGVSSPARVRCLAYAGADECVLLGEATKACGPPLMSMEPSVGDVGMKDSSLGSA